MGTEHSKKLKCYIPRNVHQNLREIRWKMLNTSVFWKNLPKNAKKDDTHKSRRVHNFLMRKSLTQFCWNIEVWAVQKHVNLLDLAKSFPTNIFLQNLASIQPITSLVEFARSPRTGPPGGAQEEEPLQANQAASPVCPAEFGRDPRDLLRDLHHDVLRLDPSDYR